VAAVECGDEEEHADGVVRDGEREREQCRAPVYRHALLVVFVRTPAIAGPAACPGEKPPKRAVTRLYAHTKAPSKVEMPRGALRPTVGNTKGTSPPGKARTVSFCLALPRSFAPSFHKTIEISIMSTEEPPCPPGSQCPWSEFTIITHGAEATALPGPV
jgi:hypothetical protein